MTNSILKPGFLFWDGAKYIFSPGTFASGPAGGDLFGNYPNPFISSLSYSGSPAGGPIAINGTGTTIVIDAANTGFSLTQTKSTVGAGHTLSITAQAAQTGSNANGGVLALRGGPADGSGNGGNANLTAGFSISGNGGSANITGGSGGSGTGGNVTLTSGVGAQGGNIILNTQGSTPGSISFRAVSDEFLNINGDGSACNMTLPDGMIGGFNLTQTQSTIGGGADMTFAAQDAFTSSGATGGRVFINGGAGDGAGTGGYVQIRSGNSSAGTGGQIILNTQGSSPGFLSFQQNSTEYMLLTVEGSFVDFFINQSAGGLEISSQTPVAGNGNPYVFASQNAASGGGGNGGDFNLFAGSGDGVGTGGSIQLNGGDNSTGNGGKITLNNQGSVPGKVSFQANSNEYLNFTTNAITWSANSVNPTITMAPAIAGGGPMTIAGQNAGGTNQGGYLIVGGGQHSGANKSDGVFWVGTPMNVGELEFMPSNGTNNLNNFQSNSGMINLLAGASAPFTINLIRAIVDTSFLFVRNNTSQTATIAYLSGGTVTVATGTSALIVSNGANLVKLMSAT